MKTFHIWVIDMLWRKLVVNTQTRRTVLTYKDRPCVPCDLKELLNSVKFHRSHCYVSISTSAFCVELELTMAPQHTCRFGVNTERSPLLSPLRLQRKQWKTGRGFHCRYWNCLLRRWGCVKRKHQRQDWCHRCCNPTPWIRAAGCQDQGLGGKVKQHCCYSVWLLYSCSIS